MVKLIDIAKKLGLSLTTVSRALNDYEEVSSKTKELVRQTAKEMGYVPNKFAQNLALKKSHLISLLYDDYQETISYQSFTFEVIAGVRNYFGRTPYDLIIVPGNLKSETREPLKNICYSRGIEGLFVVGIRTNDPYIEELKKDFIPAVIVDYPLITKKVTYIQSDNLMGCKLAVDYLVSRGHSRIAFINGHDLAAVSPLRLDGYKTALKENGISFDEDIVKVGNYTEKSGYDAVRQLLKEKADFSAVFAASDLMAVGAIKAIKEKGLKVPEDVAVVGFDDVFFAEYSHPSLTTIRQHKFDLGYMGAKELHEIIENPEKPLRSRKIDVELIIRESA
ncbi:MAG: LacI family transcriptional regulator [Spirochaetes bacterium]|nr:LacI family transcriptional regulator [Spirochaetota bacterium]